MDYAYFFSWCGEWTNGKNVSLDNTKRGNLSLIASNLAVDQKLFCDIPRKICIEKAFCWQERVMEFHHKRFCCAYFPWLCGYVYSGTFDYIHQRYKYFVQQIPQGEKTCIRIYTTGNDTIRVATIRWWVRIRDTDWMISKRITKKE